MVRGRRVSGPCALNHPAIIIAQRFQHRFHDAVRIQASIGILLFRLVLILKDVGTAQGAQLQARIDEAAIRSEENTSELQSLMRISYAVFSLRQKTLDNT